MDLGLKGRKAIVTGGSKGIGRAIAELLADEGCNVGICARNGDEVDAAVASLKAKGVDACGSAIDVREGDAVRKWVADCAAALGGLDIVVPNVSALAIERNEDSWRAQFEVDILHTVNTCEDALPLLEKSDAGSIVIISSVSVRSRRRLFTMPRRSPAKMPARISALIPSRPATPISKAAFGR